MHPTKLMLSGLLILSLLAPAAQARRLYGRRAVRTAVELGVIGAIASRPHYPGYYSYYGAPVYGALAEFRTLTLTVARTADPRDVRGGQSTRLVLPYR